MNRTDFMERLAVLLRDMPSEERQEAMQYYEDYFDDAGIENEAPLIQELGSPEQVAVSIKAGLQGKNDKSSEYSESGYTDTRFEDKKVPVSLPDEEDRGFGKSRKRDWTKIILLIILAVITCPIWGGVLVGVLGGALGILFGFLGILLGGICVSVAGVITGIVMIVVGIIKIFTVPPVGILTVGLGCLALALGMICTVALIRFCVWFFPWIFRGIVYLFRKLLHRKDRGGELS